MEFRLEGDPGDSHTHIVRPKRGGPGRSDPGSPRAAREPLLSSSVFFNGWDVLLRTLLVGAAAYLALVVLVRVSGKRTLAKMNAFDLVVTVALGSTLATIVVSDRVSLAQGLVAFLVLIGLQFAITWLSVRSGALRKLVKADPETLLRDGEFLPRKMLRERVTREEALAAIRAAGLRDPEGVEALVLETDGSFSVVRRGGADAERPRGGGRPRSPAE